MSNSYDVITNGASLAGCTAAVLYAREGARVALLERRSAPRAHKVLCTHYIQPCAYPVTAELGLDKLLEQAGAVPNTAHYWTRWDWIIPPWHEDVKHGYSVRRGPTLGRGDRTPGTRGRRALHTPVGPGTSALKAPSRV